LLLKVIAFSDSVPVVGLLIGFNSLFFAYEMNQLMREGISDYFSSIWNYTDFFSFLSLYFVALFPMWSSSWSDEVDFITAITVFLFLLRGMSYLRIFSNLRYLINMIIQIIKDMLSFMIVLVYWIIGISMMFYIFVKAADSTGTTTFVTTLKYTYRLSYGDFNVDDYTSAEWLVFILVSIFIPLILFNLVIAIMGDTYS